jgi:putative flippase GtrA
MGGVEPAFGALARSALRSKLLRFALTGGVAALVNWTVGRLLRVPFDIHVAVVVGYLAGLITAFLLARAFVFEPSGRSPASEGARFAAVNVVSLCIVWLVTISLSQYLFPWLGYVSPAAEGVAHAIGIAAPIFPSFLMHRYFSFAPRRGERA